MYVVRGLDILTAMVGNPTRKPIAH